jgi:transposase
MEDVLEVYQRPYDPKRPVVCMDELSKQLTKETRKPIPACVRRVEKYDTEYERNGTANIFLYIEPLKARFVTKATEQRTKPDWAATIKTLVDDQYPDVEKIVLVMDNLNTHTGSSLYETFEPEEARRLLDKLEIHYTPKHGSWLNMAEIGLSMLSGQCLDRRIPDMNTLTQEVEVWTTKTNATNKKVDWQFTTAGARVKLKRLYPTILTL